LSWAGVRRAGRVCSSMKPASLSTWRTKGVVGSVPNWSSEANVTSERSSEALRFAPATLPQL
jgi:hypothetical protein